MANTKRGSEKTFGPSPESRKRPKVHRPTRTKPKAQQPKAKGSAKESNSSFVPPTDEHLGLHQVAIGAHLADLGTDGGIDGSDGLKSHDKSICSSTTKTSSSRVKANPLDSATERCPDTAKDIVKGDNECISILPKEEEIKAAPQGRRCQKEKPAKEIDGKIVVAVDFGTTFSGISWAMTRQYKPEISRMIYQWPDTMVGSIEGLSSDKVPTELQYTKPSKYKWGFQIPPDALRHQCFKLDLSPERTTTLSQLAVDYPDDRAAPSEDGKTPEDLTRDYLLALREHFTFALKPALGGTAASTVRIQYVLTTPAIWSEHAHAKMRSAAEKVGMGTGSDLLITSEPEAAALWALKELVPCVLGVGDTFVLCDAGGGTVDLITYEIEKITPRLQVTEVTKGDGDLCGSIYLNRRFKDFLRKKLGSHPMWNEDMLVEATKKFEYEIKRTYNGSKDQEDDILVPGFPDSTEYNVRRATYRLRGADLHDIFEPVIRAVIDLVIKQIEASKVTQCNVNAVVMVGGFGANSYLCERLRQAVEGSGIQILKSPNAWTAVVRGALMKGLEEASLNGSTVNGRVARNHYGTESAKEFDSTVHPPAQKYWSAANNRHEVNTYDWFVLKGDKIKEKKPRLLHYHLERHVSDESMEPVKVSIVKCTDLKNEGAPTYINNNKVRHLATLTVNLSDLPLKRMPKRTTEDGKEWYIIDIAIRVVCQSAETIYELRHKDKSYGRISAEFV
ncbi:MAG: hypothetical protein Q9220_007237 [cf. Caloplaca sp. 1 TL-2023]